MAFFMAEFYRQTASFCVLNSDAANIRFKKKIQIQVFKMKKFGTSNSVF